MIRLILLAAGLFSFVAAAEKTSADWQPTVWNGERALVSTSADGKAIVSLERGRLVSFSAAGSDTNLLFAPPTRTDPAGCGGHRLWLGPQSTWPQGWPPPDAWEHSGAASFKVTEATLRLVMPDAGDGWPQLTRIYQWSDGRLICSAELSGGTRNVQIIHIMQVPEQAIVDVSAHPERQTPLGYVQLPSVATARFTADFPAPPHVSVHGEKLTLRHLADVQKLGFAPQLLAAHEQSFSITVSRRAQTGTLVNEPDRGFFTQVYLGGPEPFTELEQLSPLFSAGTPTSFAIALEISPH